MASATANDDSSCSREEIIAEIDHAVLIPGNGCGDELDDCMWYPWIAKKLTGCSALTVHASSSATSARENESKAEEQKGRIGHINDGGKETDSNQEEEEESAATKGELNSKRSNRNIYMDLRGFPFHLEAYESEWKAFAVDDLGLSASSILIGHSSGAACSLRLLEERPIAACVLVSAYNSDLGDDLERESGYFDRPFDYDKMVANCPFIFQFHSKDDHLVPLSVAREVSQGLRKASDKYNKELSDSAATGAATRKRRSTYIYVETSSDGHFQDDEYEEVMWGTICKVLPFTNSTESQRKS